jgi:hypothetical protein
MCLFWSQQYQTLFWVGVALTTMAKRPSDEVKTWWELDFDEGPYKFRKLNRHHQPQGFFHALPVPPQDAVAPMAPEEVGHAHPQDFPQDVEMAAAMN